MVNPKTKTFRKGPLAVLGLLALVALAGCSIPIVTNASAGLHIRMGSSAKVITSDMATWNLSGTSSSDSFTRSGNASGDVVNVTGLIPGDWTLTADGFNASGGKILTGSATVTLIAGQSATAAITLTLVTADVNFTFDFSDPQAPVVLGGVVNGFVTIHETESVNVTASTGFDSYTWYVDGVEDTDTTGNVWQLAAATTGRFRLTVIVEKDGQDYSEEVVVDVIATGY